MVSLLDRIGIVIKLPPLAHEWLRHVATDREAITILTALHYKIEKYYNFVVAR